MSSAGIAFTGGRTVRLTVQWVNWASFGTDPDSGSDSLVIYDSHGNVKATITHAQMTRVAAGNYYYDYATPSVTTQDDYDAVWTATINAEPDVMEFFFTLLPL